MASTVPPVRSEGGGLARARFGATEAQVDLIGETLAGGYGASGFSATTTDRLDDDAVGPVPGGVHHGSTGIIEGRVSALTGSSGTERSKGNFRGKIRIDLYRDILVENLFGPQVVLSGGQPGHIGRSEGSGRSRDSATAAD